MNVLCMAHIPPKWMLLKTVGISVIKKGSDDDEFILQKGDLYECPTRQHYIITDFGNPVMIMREEYELIRANELIHWCEI